MTKLLRYKSFHIGFAFGIFVMLVLNYWNYIKERGSLLDISFSFGVPFDFYFVKGSTIPFLQEELSNSSQILWFGLFADILVGLIFSFAVGYFFNFIWLERKFGQAKLK